MPPNKIGGILLFIGASGDLNMTVRAKLDEHVRLCDHCGTRNLHRTFHIYNSEDEIRIGRVCLQKELGVDTSGNPHKAIKRVELFVKQMDKQDRLDEIWSLKE
jgi:hypothetical protein